MIKELLDQLVVYDVLNYTKIRLGNNYDGGYVIMNKAFKYSKIYSFGIGNDISFEANFVVNQPCEIYLCDPTIYKLPFNISWFHFKKVGLKGIEISSSLKNKFLKLLYDKVLFDKTLKNRFFNFLNNRLKVKISSQICFDTLENHLLKDGNIDDQNMFLKMDIEGDEYSAILKTPIEILKKFNQIIIEVHYIGDNEFLNIEKQLLFFKKMNKNHRIIHVHHNNCSEIKLIDGFKVPNVLEVTFLKKDKKFVFVKSKASFPTVLDFPNNIDQKDIPLDFYPFE